ncbi:hypothetical protein AC1031_012236 [Aphanomyces cochlioides]|nr:hypothetical protein AC1031_012236 [Aphanomyces cochlioides]
MAKPQQGNPSKSNHPCHQQICEFFVLLHVSSETRDDVQLRLCRKECAEIASILACEAASPSSAKSTTKDGGGSDDEKTTPANVKDDTKSGEKSGKDSVTGEAKKKLRQSREENDQGRHRESSV